MWPYDPGFPIEQPALYQAIDRAREPLSVILRVVALAVAPPSRVVNMVNGMRNEEMTLLGEDDSGDPRHSCTYASASLLVYKTIMFFASS